MTNFIDDIKKLEEKLKEEGSLKHKELTRAGFTPRAEVIFENGKIEIPTENFLPYSGVQNLLLVDWYLLQSITHQAEYNMEDYGRKFVLYKKI